jgi:hypothetical protein
MRSKVLSPVFLLALAPGLLPAQPADPEAPPAVLNIFREEVKPGRMATREKISAGFTAVLAKANPDMHWIGLTPITGDPNVVLYIEGLASYKALEESRIKMQATLAQNVALKTEMDRLDLQGSEITQNQRGSIFVHRPNLSYRPARMSDVAKSRLMAITTIRVKPGRIPDYIDYTRTLNAAREKAGASWVSNVVYQVSAGGPGGTFLSFSPVRSLAEWDEREQKADERQKAMDAAIGGDQVVKMRRELISEILIEPPITNVYAMSKVDSRPSPQFAAYDPEFWTPKPVVSGKALATKKESPKDAPKQ